MDQRRIFSPDSTANWAGNLSDDIFRLFVDSVTDYAIFILDTAGHIISWNPGAERINGYTADDVLGKHFSIFYPADLVEGGHPAYELSVALAQGHYEEEGQRIRKDGSVFWAIVTISALKDASGSHIGFAKVTRDITERKRLEHTIQASANQFRALVEGAPDSIFVQTDRRFAYMNAACVRLLGASSADDILGQNVLDRFDATYHQQLIERMNKLNEKREKVGFAREVMIRLDGEPVDVEVNAVPVRFNEKDGALVFVRDVTEQIRAERESESLQSQLLQAQRMEAVGRLAGGVAHDFNNMLSVILGHAELAMDALDSETPLYSDLEEIRNAARRSADLTRQLLAFARKQTISPKPLYLNDVIANMLNMLRRLLGEDIDLLWKPGKGIHRVLMDSSQVDQILANLLVNARDAITGVGKITIETSNAEFDEEYCETHIGFSPGRFVLLAVSDNGCGMDRVTASQIFEPFFTTKEVGKGTGLGLATVYGIVKQNRGFINVYSEPGKGTTFKIYLSPVESGDVLPTEKRKIGPAKMGAETVLVVEDEELVLALTKRMLERFEYTVLTANNPNEAIEIAGDFHSDIRLLITDVVMPGMSGRELWEALRDVRPEMKCLFMSGFTADVIAHHGVLDDDVYFLPKPFSSLELSEKVREVLDSP